MIEINNRLLFTILFLKNIKSIDLKKHLKTLAEIKQVDHFEVLNYECI
mgnify:CR=1 FL=1